MKDSLWIFHAKSAEGKKPKRSLGPKREEPSARNNAGVLIYGAQILGIPEYIKVAQEVAQHAIERYHQYQLEWPAGISARQMESPDLMLGKAGTGYYFLRLYDPEKVFPVLIVDPAFNIKINKRDFYV